MPFDALPQTTTITPTQLKNRRELINLLRTTKIEQLRDGNYYRGYAPPLGRILARRNSAFAACALGVYIVAFPRTETFERECGFSVHETRCIVFMNDHEGKTFLEIANYIESLPV